MWQLSQFYKVTLVAFCQQLLVYANVTKWRLSQFYKVNLVTFRQQLLVMQTLPPSVSQLYRKCGSLNISQPHGPAQPVTGIALLYWLHSANNCHNKKR
jgi:hypothetical protein